MFIDPSLAESLGELYVVAVVSIVVTVTFIWAMIAIGNRK